MTNQKNVFGGKLEMCSTSPMTGFYRDGCCTSGSEDLGLHVVCIEVTEEFLEFSSSRGNDLTTPVPEYQFPGLKPGDRWCLCALRWKEALDAGIAPPVILASTNEIVLEIISLQDLKKHAIDLS